MAPRRDTEKTRPSLPANPVALGDHFCAINHLSSPRRIAAVSISITAPTSRTPPRHHVLATQLDTSTFPATSVSQRPIRVPPPRLGYPAAAWLLVLAEGVRGLSSQLPPPPARNPTGFAATLQASTAATHLGTPMNHRRPFHPTGANAAQGRLATAQASPSKPPAISGPGLAAPSCSYCCGRAQPVGASPRV
ncbi:hypothetical protein E2562_003412 [Oryza meyeriana var. granulata]|uniref:Uncharacterized protein n=1 Tax=Oryza meyeriana var. granulata TaxID=110450 RepID=A0A6G1EEU3_9ORYZ|nr:hypothetical protein E2562_003412 [Oryza meyeriana var. granulata]